MTAATNSNTLVKGYLECEEINCALLLKTLDQEELLRGAGVEYARKHVIESGHVVSVWTSSRTTVLPGPDPGDYDPSA